MLGGLRAGDVEISNFVKVMHVLGGASIFFIGKASGVVDDRYSVSSAGVGTAGGLSARGGRAVAG